MTKLQPSPWRSTSRGWLWMPPPVTARPAPSPRHKAIRHVALFALGCLGLIILSYLVVEALSLRFVQPWRLDHMHKVRFFQVEVKRPDVVYLGTSQVLNGVMPAVVAEAAAAAGRPFANVGYNLAVPGAELEISWILARDLLHGDQQPRHLVLGVFPLIVAGGQRWAPDFYHRYGTLTDVAQRAWVGDVPWSQVAAVGMRGVENLLQWPFYRLKKPIRDFHWTHLRQSHGGTFLPSEADGEITEKAGLWEQVAADMEKVDVSRLRFADDTHAADLLRRFHALARARNFKLTIFYPPQRIDQPAFEARYHAWMRDFCQREGLTYLDLHHTGTFQRRDFTDPYHLNARGAYRLSQLLGQRLASQ
jgi:hypothetical protein